MLDQLFRRLHCSVYAPLEAVDIPSASPLTSPPFALLKIVSVLDLARPRNITVSTEEDAPDPEEMRGREIGPIKVRQRNCHSVET